MQVYFKFFRDFSCLCCYCSKKCFQLDKNIFCAIFISCTNSLFRNFNYGKNMDQKFSYLEKIGKESSNLIKGLQAIQGVEGYVSDDGIRAAAEYFNIPAVEVEGVLSFYAQFKRVKPGRFKIAVCDGTACHIKGSSQVGTWIQQELGIRDGETDKEGRFSLETVACLGCCSLAPVMSINGRVFGKLDRRTMSKILKEYREK